MQKVRFWDRSVQGRTFLMVVAVLITLVASLTFAYSSTVTQSSYKQVYGERVVTDAGMSVGNTGLDISMADAAAVGDTLGSKVEMAPTTYGTANTALTNNNWEFNVDVYESAVDSITSGDYKVEFYVNGALQGTLYITQATPDAGTVEGVTCTFDLGADLSADMTILIKVSAA